MLRFFLLFAATLLLRTAIYGQWIGPHIYDQAGQTFQRVETADLNADDLPDLLGYQGQLLVALLQQPDGTLGIPDTLCQNFYNSGVYVIRDMDQDGLPDVVYNAPDGVWLIRQKLSVPGKFDPPKPLWQHPIAGLVAVGDVNGDDLPDVVVFGFIDNSLRAAWLAGDGAGGVLPGLNDIQTSTSLVFGELADIDGDGDRDFLWVTGSGGVRLFWAENSGGGFSPAVQIDSLPTYPLLKTGQLDGAGGVDIAMLSYNFDTQAYEFSMKSWQPGGAFLTRALPLGGGQDISEPFALGDFNNDGTLDIALSVDNELTVFRNNGSAVFTQATTPPNTWPAAGNARAADWNQDGNTDLLVTVYGTFGWIANDGSGLFQSMNLLYPSLNLASDVQPADFDADGLDDVMTVSLVDGRIEWRPNLGNGQLGPPQAIGLFNVNPVNAFAARLSDQPGADVIMSIGRDSMIYLFSNTGSGLFGEPVPLFRGLLAHAPYDLNQDGRLDLIYYDYDQPGLFWRSNTGTGFDLPRSLGFNVLPGTFVMAIDDLDLDGDPDLCLRHGTQLACYLNDGNQQFWSPASIPDIPDLQQHLLADVNGDGFKDLAYVVWPNKLYVMLNASGGQFIHPVLIADPNPYCPLLYTAADFDLDGDVDFLGTARVDSFCIDAQKMLYLRKNGGVYDAVEFSSSALFDHQGAQLADLDDDGDPDLLFFSHVHYGWLENGGSLPPVRGLCFQDLNENGQRDPGEEILSDFSLSLQPDALVTFSSQNGYFEFFVPPGNYTLAAIPPSCWEPTTGQAGYQVVFTGAPLPLFEFGFKPAAIVPQAEVLLYSGFPRCDTEIPVQAVVKNSSCGPVQGRLSLRVPGKATFLYAQPAPDQVSADSLTWNIPVLAPSQNYAVSLTVLMPGAVHVGDTLVWSGTVVLTDSAGNPAFAQTTNYADELRCSYDPNDKLVSPASLTPGYSAEEARIRYTVRFQNTGNDTAFLVRILDTLDARLDWTGLRPLAASHHPYILNLDAQTGVLSVEFQDIRLVDSLTNPLGSQGYVMFELALTPGLPGGSEVENRAAIYFDQNLPIITPPAIVLVRELTGIAVLEPSPDVLEIFPNPVDRNHARVRWSPALQDGAVLQVFHSSGRLMRAHTVSQGALEAVVDMTGCPAGVYYVALKQGAGRPKPALMIKL